VSTPNPIPENSKKSSPIFPIIASLAILVVGVGAVVFLLGQPKQTQTPSSSPSTTQTTPLSTPPPNQVSQLVREDSNIVGDPSDGSVVLVEFLDYECEACGAWYPTVEQLRQQYEGQVQFVHRYFPLPSHSNSVNAALAAEAAAQQGAYEQMYKRLFETQKMWGHSGESQAPLFREYALEFELDMDQYDATISDPKTLERIQQDFSDGTELGVQGTPTFFLNGEQVRPNNSEEFAALLDASILEAR
jgi:protein-disulfide isomerase